MTYVLVIVDMQVGLFSPATPRYDTAGVISRINSLSGVIRQKGGTVIFIQHDGPEGDVLEPGTPGWDILPALARKPTDQVVRKKACDAFYETDLALRLEKIESPRLIITGCATDFCVDTTVRSAASRDYDLTVAADAHTTADRPHLDAPAIIRHHNWVWENLILPRRQIRVVPAELIIEEMQQAAAPCGAGVLVPRLCLIFSPLGRGL